jgi:hypothetical protein
LNLKKQNLKQGYRFIGSRVEIRRLSSYGSTLFNLYSPTKRCGGGRRQLGRSGGDGGLRRSVAVQVDPFESKLLNQVFTTS